MAQSVAPGNASRRRFLRLAISAATLAGAGGLLAACSTTAPSAPTAAPAAKPTTSTAATAPTTVSAAATGVKVGVLNSLSGTMAISEVAVKNASLMAIDEINKKGGVLGSQLVPVVQDGASDWPTFADKTK